MDPFYRAFEERYRGSRESIESSLEVYLPFIEPLKSLYEAPEILDLGCGRGEWLELLQHNGFQAKGVDLDEGMLLACRELNLDVCHVDALDYLRGMEADSLSVVSAFHVVEHIPFEALRQLVDEAYRVLKPGGLLILETPNSENLAVGTSDFYLDPTHQRPLPAKLLGFVIEYTGFARVKTLYLQEPTELVTAQRTSLINVLYGVSPDYAIIAQKKAAAEVFSIFDEPFDRSYGLRLDILADRYDQQTELRAAQIETSAAKVEARTSQVEARTSQFEARVEALAVQIEARAVQAENRAAQVEARVEALAVQAEARAVQAEARAKEAQIIIQQMVLSSSWRITAPLRHIKVEFSRLNAAIREGRLISGLKRRINLLRYRPIQSVLPQEQKQINLSPRASRIYADLQKAIEARKN
jgi:SAM-dependent methyltransferase